MNAVAHTFTVAFASVAAAAAIGVGLANGTAEAATDNVVKLERVVIVAQRSDVVAQLPRVVVEGRRAELANTAMAAAKHAAGAV